MNRILIVAGAMLMAGAAAAKDAPKDVAVVMTAADRTNWMQIDVVMDRCVGAALRGDVSVCNMLGAFLREFAGKVKAADAPPPK